MKDINLKNIMPATEYEAYTSKYLKPWDAMILKRCAEENNQKSAQGTLLDVGTGTGVLLEELHKIQGFENYRLIGIDYYQDNVIEATAKFKERSLDNYITVVQGDAHALDFSDDTFDMVISRATIHHLVDPVKALQEKYRVLKPNGVCLIHDMRRDVPIEILEKFNALRAKANYPPTKVHEKYTVSEMRAFLDQAGLSDCSYVYAEDNGMAALGYEVKIWKN
ncbi:class I SAM-dependent methyltransferase [uncultured Dokdonia sp.]|uniref:class I SAM-dependent methyltransferase n=1 Tax=uncultured Dokdonia sp. TaxID=575653 RepID=UPI00260FC8D5|nr:class I SAM-dependent methyltransferase [uncultured Dokdonia sp.]